jgi:hypothetical protein
MWLYEQSASNPKQWDPINLSEDIGPINDRATFLVSRRGLKILLFWTDDGPACAYVRGREAGWKPLWEPLCDALQEQEVDEVPGLAISQFANVSGGFQPITQQACFGVWEVTATENNCTVRYDLRGLVAYIDGELDQPVVTIRNNSQTGVYPCDILFQIMVDRNGLLDTSGRPRLFGGRQGIIYELDPPNYFTDNGDLIPLNIVRDGYNGQEEGISGFEKVATKSRVRGTQNSEFAVVVTVFADGGSESDSDDLSLSANLGAWGDGGVWTDSKAVGQWNAASIQARRGNHGVHGKNFKMQVRDNGAINGDFELSELSIEGHTYERQ